VGYGGSSKADCYRDLKKEEVPTILVCDDNDRVPSHLFGDVIRVKNLHDHKHDKETASKIRDVVNSRKYKVAGVLTLWEDCGPLAAIVGLHLDLPSNGYGSASLAKDKDRTQQKLLNSSDVNVRNLATKTQKISDHDDLKQWFEAAAQKASLLKLAFGSSAAGVFEAPNYEKAVHLYNKVKRDYFDESDLPGIGLGFGNDVVICERHSGSEHDVDIVMYAGRAVACFVTDNGPTGTEYFAELTASMPSLLPVNVQNRLKELSVLALNEVGLISGVFNLEYIISSEQPKLIDINARMGGFYIRDWIRRIWGYDILTAALSCAKGVMPKEPSTNPNGYISGAMLLPSSLSEELSEEQKSAILGISDEYDGFFVSIFEEDLHVNFLADEPWVNVACHASSRELSFLKLEMALRNTGVMAVDLDLERSLKELGMRHGKI
ncbi:MAG: hypothetical protein ABJG37_20730, partial [Ekhidna sp.]